MKANARKILALIMAMVMCLSLAAPAFAAEEAVEDTSAEASVVETVETEEKEEKLEKQEAPVYASILKGSMTDNGFQISTTENGYKVYPESGEYKWAETDKYPTYVEVKTTPVTDNNQIGNSKKTKYTISIKSDYVNPDASAYDGTHVKAAEWLVKDDPEVKYSLKDKDIAWTELNEKIDWFTPNGQTAAKRVKGYSYQEKQTNGNYVIYYKLTPVDDKGEFKTSVKDNEWVYLTATKRGSKAEFTEKLTREDDQRDALATAMTVTEYGELTSAQAIVDAKVTMPYGDLDAGATVSYDFGVKDEVGATVLTTVPSGRSPVSVDFKPGVTSATFAVRVVKTTTYPASEKKDPVQVVIKDADTIKGLLSGSYWRVDSVTADTGDYFAVAVTDMRTAPVAAPLVDNNKAKSNVLNYYVDGQQGVAGLADLAADGFYNAADDKNSDKTAVTIDAGKKLYGPVAVKASDVEVKDFLFWGMTYEQAKGNSGFARHYDATNGFYIFDSLEQMQENVSNRYCIEDKTVPYIRLVMNKANGGVKNNLVQYEGSRDTSSVEPIADWYTAKNVADNASFVESGTATFAKSTQHVESKTVDVVPATCLKTGTETTKIFCRICGKVIAEESVKTLPIVLTNAAKGTESNYALTFADGTELTATATAAQYNRLSDTAKALYELVGGTYTMKKGVHYIAKREIKTTNPSKGAAGTKTTTYTCNLGEVHTELTKTEEIEKKALEHSGKWDYVSWSTQNTNDVRNPKALYGYTVTVADTDVDDATLPMNATAGQFFKFDEAAAETDGTYVSNAQVVNNIDIYSVNGTVKTKNTGKNYAAIAIVKDIEKGAKECQDGKAVVEVNVYETATAYATPALAKTALTTDLQKNIKNKEVTLKQTYTMPVVVPAEKTHVDANDDGKCDNCGTEINQGATEPTGKIDMSTATVKFTALKWTGKKAQPKVEVTLDGVKLAKGVDYEVEEMQDVNAGTYPLIVKGKGDFTGRVVGNVTINKAKQPMTVKATAPSAKKLKKKAQKVGLTIKKAQGKVTVKVSGPASVKGTTVTAKKGTKKGKKIKITVTAAGNDNYKKGSKTVTVKVKA